MKLTLGKINWVPRAHGVIFVFPECQCHTPALAHGNIAHGFEKHVYELGNKVKMECEDGYQLVGGGPYTKCDGTYWRGLSSFYCRGIYYSYSYEKIFGTGGVCSTVVEPGTHMWVYAGSSPTGTDHRKELISTMSRSLNDVK